MAWCWRKSQDCKRDWQCLGLQEMCWFRQWVVYQSMESSLQTWRSLLQLQRVVLSELTSCSWQQEKDLLPQLRLGRLCPQPEGDGAFKCGLSNFALPPFVQLAPFVDPIIYSAWNVSGDLPFGWRRYPCRFSICHDAQYHSHHQKTKWPKPQSAAKEFQSSPQQTAYSCWTCFWYDEIPFPMFEGALHKY